MPPKPVEPSNSNTNVVSQQPPATPNRPPPSATPSVVFDKILDPSKTNVKATTAQKQNADPPSASPSGIFNNIFTDPSKTNLKGSKPNGVPPPPSASPSIVLDKLFADPSKTNLEKQPTTGPQKPAALVSGSKSAPDLSTRHSSHKKPKDQKPHRVAPDRELVKSHHKHHVVPVGSETDFTKMRIDEKKINYLPYNPPVAVSQTGLIQSIGKPFNPNHAKYLPDPGDEFQLTRRVSQCRLNQVSLLGDVNKKIVDGFAGSIKTMSILIGVS